MWFNFHKSKHRYYNVKLLQYELFWMNLTRLSCQKCINFGKLYSRGLSCKKRINTERHIQPCTQIRLRTDRFLIRIMMMHTCAAHYVIFRPLKFCIYKERHMQIHLMLVSFITYNNFHNKDTAMFDNIQ
jgi:hypothetical protein